MRLSIITINLNNADGLRKTMLSVINQTRKDIEYIVVDGASTDGSMDIIQDCFSCTDNGMSVKWISEPDLGIYNAMNKGIRMSSGEYLLFLNSGDWLTDSNVIKELNNEGFTADIVVAKCNVVKDDKIVWTYFPKKTYTFGTLYFYGIAHQSAFIKKDLFEKYGLYDESYKYNGDLEFWYRTIIDNKVTTQMLNIVVANYSLGGLSDVLKGDLDFENEHKRILSNPLYEKFVGDYEVWKKDREWINKYRVVERYPAIVRLLAFIDRKKRKVL